MTQKEKIKYIKEKIVKINKPHVCLGCGRIFPKDSEMLLQVVKVEDSFVWNIYLCESCQEVRREYESVYNKEIEFSEGDLLEDALNYEFEFKK